MTEIELSFFVLFCQTPLIITLFLFLYKTWIGVDFFVKNLRTAKTIKNDSKGYVVLYIFFPFSESFFHPGGIESSGILHFGPVSLRHCH